MVYDCLFTDGCSQKQRDKNNLNIWVNFFFLNSLTNSKLKNMCLYPL